MRADRLVAILMLLQTRGQVTAAEVAVELEVSERTARRDLDALGMAGVPVYSKQGRGGGYQLVGGARTDLSGLNANETRALFLVAGAASATPEVKAALRKLVRALPETFRDEAEAASSAIVVDPTAWGHASAIKPPPPHLDVLQQAVISGEQVRLGYVARDRSPSTRVVHPLGLAAKGQVWYLIADTEAGQRTFRIDRVTSVEGTGEPVVRPKGFDLARSWALVRDEINSRHVSCWARGTAAPEVVPMLRMALANRVRIGPAGNDGRVEIEAGGASALSLAVEIAGFGHRIELTEPAEVCAHLVRIGRELADLYSSRGFS